MEIMPNYNMNYELSTGGEVMVLVANRCFFRVPLEEPLGRRVLGPSLDVQKPHQMSLL